MSKEASFYGTRKPREEIVFSEADRRANYGKQQNTIERGLMDSWNMDWQMPAVDPNVDPRQMGAGELYMKYGSDPGYSAYVQGAGISKMGTPIDRPVESDRMRPSVYGNVPPEGWADRNQMGPYSPIGSDNLPAYSYRPHGIDQSLYGRYLESLAIDPRSPYYSPSSRPSDAPAGPLSEGGTWKDLM